MSSEPIAAHIIRFGLFELDLSAGQLRRQNRIIKLQDQPFQVLVLLLRHPGEVVTREELQQALWPGDTFVEFDQGVNTAIKKIRLALGDSADNPRFVETLPRKGYRFIAPVNRSIGEASAVKAQPTPVDERAVSLPEVGPVKRRKTEVLAWVLLGVVSAMLVVLVNFRGRPLDVHRARFLVPIPEKLSLEWFDRPAVSPDGRKFVFGALGENGKRQLWIRSLDALAAEPLAGTEGGGSPFWSPDSRFIAFLTRDNKLKKTEASTGALVQTICEAPGGPPGAWSRDDVILFSGQTGLSSVSAAGGQVRGVLERDPRRHELGQTYPEFLPDARHFLFYSQSADPGKSGTYLGTLGSKEVRLVIADGSNAQYVLPGFLIFGRGETLLAQPFDASELQLTREPVAIAPHVRDSVFLGSLFSASDTGILVYRNQEGNIQLAWHARDGKRLQPIGEPGRFLEMGLSPDEKRLALERTDPQNGSQNIWILELTTGILSRLTFVSANDSDLVWSPDGRDVVFSSMRKGRVNLYQKMVSGGEEELIYQSGEGESNYAYQWLKDGKSILFLDGDGKTFYRLPLNGERKPAVLLKSEFNKDGFSVSPDERWAAYSSLESGRYEVYVAAFPSFTEKRQVSNNGGCQPVWRKDSKELFYLALDGKLMVTEMTGRSTTLITGLPQVLFQSSLQVNPNIHQYNVTGDGRKFIFGEPVKEGPEQLTVVLNWLAGLKR